MLTVILATYNGSQTLGRMLQQLTLLTEPPGGWKLVVVDNGSTDDTATILKSYMTTLPLQFHTEVTRGKNNALNSVLSEIEGDLVVFTDDDVLPNKNWLCELRSVADRNPEADLFGGPIEPEWPELTDLSVVADIPFGPAFALSDPATESGPIRSGKIWGPNMAVRKRVFDQGIKFDGTIGPTKGQYLMGSESDFLARAEKAGHNAIWTNAATVRHIIRDYQLTRQWLKGRAFRYGRACFFNSHKAQLQDAISVRILGIPRWILVQYIAYAARRYFAIATGRISRLPALDWKTGEFKGMVFEARRARKGIK